jgi:hypothetical protein
MSCGARVRWRACSEAERADGSNGQSLVRIQNAPPGSSPSFTGTQNELAPSTGPAASLVTVTMTVSPGRALDLSKVAAIGPSLKGTRENALGGE